MPHSPPQHGWLFHASYHNEQNGKNYSQESKEMVKQENSSPTAISLEWLPVEVIHRILSYCNSRTLLALAGTCCRFYALINDDYVWHSKAKQALASNCRSSKFSTKSVVALTNQNKCAIESRWKRSIYQETILIKNKNLLIPCLSIDSSNLWVTRANTLCKFQRFKDGRVKTKPSMKLKCHSEDILKFKVTNSFIATASLDGTLAVWDKQSGSLLSTRYKAHTTVINSIDCFNSKLLITGSKDRHAKIWNLNFDGLVGNENSIGTDEDDDPSHSHECSCSLSLAKSIFIGDRVLSVSCSDDRGWAAIGSAGCTSNRPIWLYDLIENRLICSLNDEHRHGAGVLGIQWEDFNTLLTCGYDTLIRLWDLRSPPGKCSLKWEDPHDSAIYSLATDHWVTILSGTCHYGVVRLWDKRKAKQCIQMYYTRSDPSPVYSLDFDPSYLYVALDRSINLLDFRLATQTNST